MLCDADPKVHYFPSYEIITSNASRGRYYAEDLRNVTEDGVNHVMRLVLQHATASSEIPKVQSPAARSAATPTDNRPSQKDVSEWVEVMCDEEALDR